MKNRAVLVVLAIAAIASLWFALSRCGGGAASRDPESGPPTTAARDLDPRNRARVPAAKAPRASLSGRVSGEDGKAIAGARVCAALSSWRVSSRLTRFDRCVASGEDGGYRIGDLVPGRYEVSAAAPGFLGQEVPDADADKPLILSPGEDRGGVDLELRAGGVHVTGVVSDIGGGPVAGAEVSVHGLGHPPFVTRSGEDGRFVAWVAKGMLFADAAAQGYTDGQGIGFAPGADLEILLTPESVITGVVVEAGSDRPVSGARVSAGDRRDVTGEDGRFRIAGLEPGRYKPGAEAVGRTGVAAESVLLGVGETAEGVRVEVYPAFVLTGELRTPEGGPCTDGSVSLEDPRQQRGDAAYPDDRGRIEFDALFPGTYGVRLWCRGHPTDESAPDIVIEDADVLDQVWTLSSRGAILAGVVRTAGGQPAEGVSVRVESKGAKGRAQRNRGGDETDRRGRFEVRGLRAGEVEVRVEARDTLARAEPITATLEEGRRTSVTIRITLESGGAIEGTVRDARGEPVAGVLLSGGGAEGQSRDDGHFRIEGVRPGDVNVIARGRRGRSLRTPGDGDRPSRVEVAAGETSHLDLVVETQSGVIHGKVVDSNGAPVTDAFVSAERQSGRAGRARYRTRWSGWGRPPALTDSDGAFTVKDLAPGRYTLRAFRRGGGEGFAEDVDIGGDVTVTIPETGSITGRVAVAGGGAPERFTASVEDKSTGFSRSEWFFRTGGAWALHDLPAGDFVVSVTAPDGVANTRLTLAAGAHREGVALTLAGRATVKGRLVALDSGEPVPGLVVSATPVEGGGGTPRWGARGKDRKNVSDESGRFELEGAPAGRVIINTFPVDYHHSRYYRVRQPATLEPGAVVDLGDVPVPPVRLEDDERPGDLGFTTVDPKPGQPLEERRFEVALVRDDGPAAGSGLRAGDVIVSVDGHDVRGAHAYYFYALVRAPPGTKLALGLERGETVSIVTGPPR